MVNEIWKDIEGYKGHYRVSNMGRVKSLNYHRSGYEKILKPVPDSNGYLFVNLSFKSEQKSFLVHRLVALAFLKMIEGKEQINHIDGDKTNNKVSNLEWVTRSENMKHALDTNLINPKKRIPAMLTDKQVKEIRRSYIRRHEEYGLRALAKKYGVSRSTIEKIVSGKTYKSTTKN